MTTRTDLQARADRGYLGGDSGLFGWIFSTDHKRIGLLYFYLRAHLLLVGVGLGLLIRLELIAPGHDHHECPDLQCHLHPARGDHDLFVHHPRAFRRAFGNLLLPIMIGARDVAFPRLNLLSW